MIAAAKAHRWHWCLPLGVLCCLLTWVLRTEILPLPFLAAAVPVPALLGVVATVVAVTPLSDTFPSLSSALARERGVRVARVAGAVVLAAVGHLPALVPRAGEPDEWPGAVAAWSTLLAVGLASVVLIGDYAWLPVLGVGLTALTLETSTTPLVARGLTVVPPVAGVAALVLTAAVCAVRGPRRLMI